MSIKSLIKKVKEWIKKILSEIPDEPTEPPTNPPTEPPTEPPTNPPTEPPTNPPTDPNPPVTGDISINFGSEFNMPCKLENAVVESNCVRFSGNGYAEITSDVLTYNKSFTWIIDLMVETFNHQGRMLFGCGKVGGKGPDLLFRPQNKTALRWNNEGVTWKEPILGSRSNAGGADHYALFTKCFPIGKRSKIKVSHDYPNKMVSIWYDDELVFKGAYEGTYDALNSWKLCGAYDDESHKRGLKAKLYSFSFTKNDGTNPNPPTTPPTTPPTIPSDPPVTPPSNEIIKGLMSTDWLLTKELSKLRDADAGKLKDAGYNTIYCPLDLTIIRPDGVGQGSARPHVGAGRLECSVTDLLVSNIKWVASKGFRVMVVASNEPSVRHGNSHLMSGFGFTPSLKPQNIYTNQRLENDVLTWKDLLKKCGEFIYGGMLYLEPSHSSSKSYQRSLADGIRALGFSGKLYSDGIGDGKIGRYDSANVKSSEETAGVNTLDAWKKDGADLRNADGWGCLDQNHSLVKQFASMPGTDGYILWFDSYRGNANGPSQLPQWVLDIK